MSGAPKRLHEEGSHSTPTKRPLDDSSLYSSPGKAIQSSGSDFHGSFDHDVRFTKIQRVEPRDDKRPPLTHRIPGSSTNLVDHPISSDSRLESKQNKDTRDTKADDRETKADARDVYSDPRTEPQGNKVESDVKVDNRADESEIKAERRGHADYKGDIKFDKDSHHATSSNLGWKDNKEHRGKRYFEQASDNVDWRLPRPGLQGTDETPKGPTSVEERNSKDAHESTGDNKTEPKSEDKFRDKDRKKKDEKHRDFSVRESDRNDRRTSIQIGGSGVERREMQREDRDSEKWDRERKDSLRDKEVNDREKDSSKKDSSVVIEKDNPILEKASSDGAVKSAEQENTTTESKVLKDDAWKAHDRDPKDKKREKDVDIGDRQEQRSKYNDKESDDNGTEGDIEKDKDAFGSVQRRRMVRPRGGKSEVPAIVYKAGECMQELLKSWKEFEATQDAKNAESLQNGPTLEIRIPAEFVTSTNRQVKGAQLWGTDIYTNDSDLVAVLMHTGYCSPTSSPPPSAIQELRATVRVLPPQESYTSTLRNNVRSRAWGAGIGCSFRIERCCIVKKGGGTIDLEPRLSHTSAVEPTLAPVLQDNLEWEDVQWSQTGVWVAGKEYPLARVHFLSAK
nr:unnamed protein product [Digitaria exilis]